MSEWLGEDNDIFVLHDAVNLKDAKRVARRWLRIRSPQVDNAIYLQFAKKGISVVMAFGRTIPSYYMGSAFIPAEEFRDAQEVPGGVQMPGRG